MKHFLLLALSMLALTGYAQSTSVYIADTVGAFTNVRNAPKGKVVYQLSTEKIIMLEVSSPQNGWWQIEGGKVEYTGDDDEVVTLTGSDTGYWIHYSVLAFTTRNYGNQKLCLRKSPDVQSEAVFTFEEEKLFHPLEVRGDWLKVTDGKHTGWIQDEWLCSNPLTNCC